MFKWVALKRLPFLRSSFSVGCLADVLSIVLEAYGAIDDPDALYALPSTYMLIGNASSTTSSTTTGAASTALAVVPGGPSGDPGATEAARNAAAAAALGLTGGHPQGPQLALSLFEREGQWQAALAGHDLGLRSMGLGASLGCEGRAQLIGGGVSLGAAEAGNLAAGYGVGGGGAGARGAAAAAAVGMVSALRHMGGDVAARVFLSGLASQQGQPGASALGPGTGGGEPGGLGAPGQLQELQYELSWRLGAWDTGAPSAGMAGHGTAGGFSGGSSFGGGMGGAGTSGLGAGGDASSGTGLHECVLRCLSALAGGDSYQVGHQGRGWSGPGGLGTAALPSLFCSL